MIDRHLVESLALRPLLVGRRIADVGTGAGLPGLPLSIVEADRQFTLIRTDQNISGSNQESFFLSIDEISIQGCFGELRT